MTQRTENSLGAVPGPAGTCFRVWAPGVDKLGLVSGGREYAMTPEADGYFSACVAEIRAGALYQYRVGGRGDFPDPASRFQPQGVHEPSQVVDPQAFSWTDAQWRGIDISRLAIYELHTGAFSPEGTFAGVLRKLPELKKLGVTAIELMPVADFPGERNWGYDGVAPYAPARCYGAPDDLCRLVDQAHALGLAVFLDVVYNHLGPDGNYTGVYSPYYFTDRHRSPWGAGLNLDGEHSGPVRRFFIENACMWIREYHIDGLRLDATHAIEDASAEHFLAELARAARAAAPGRKVHVIAEDNRNLAHMLREPARGGWGLDGVWADDWHHQMRCRLAGDSDGYYQDYSGRVADIALTAQQGWYYTGQVSAFSGKPRGSEPAGIRLRQMVYCLQNHDQIGNRALGERLHHQIDSAAHRAAAALLFFLPQIPLVFMGQEWEATTPFLYFTDHHEELGRLVTRGRREEFKTFKAFSHPELREKIPDPQDPATFEQSRLRWEEREQSPHAEMLRYYQHWLGWRLAHLAEDAPELDDVVVRPLSDSGLSVERGPYLLLVQLVSGGVLEWRGPENRERPGAFEVCFTSEDAGFAPAPAAPAVEVLNAEAARIRFQRPGAVLLQFQVRKEHHA